MADCSAKREWCKGLSAICGILTLIVAVQAVAMSAQERKIVQLEDKNDTIVELRTDMRYVKDGMAEIKTMLKNKP